MFGEEWQTPALYSALLIVVAFVLWRWHTNDTYKNFCLLHAIADRDGFYNADKAHMTGAFIVTTFAVVVSVIRNAVTLDVALLVGGYSSVWALKQAWTYTVARRNETDVRREEIRRGRRDDVEGMTVEEIEEESQRTTPRRRKSDRLLG